MPAVAGSPALRLAGRSGGRRLFDEADAGVARDLAALMIQAEATRDAYRRGVLAERERIAQDLHDDVNARLLTSLHREEAGDIRSDVRKAMADIRAMVASLVGEDAPVDQVLAELRYEAAERLRAAGLDLEWPLGREAAGLLPAREAKALGSAMREVVSNVIRHAQARRVTVETAWMADLLTLTVTDDGIGAAEAPARPGGGLANLGKRMAQVGGSAVITHRAPGVSIRLTLPVAPASEVSEPV